MCEGIPKFTGCTLLACFCTWATAMCFQLPACVCVQPIIESGIIQDAQQEAFIWLSLCFAASANINPEISLFCHSSVGGRESQQTCCIYISFLEHLFSEERHSCV